MLRTPARLRAARAAALEVVDRVRPDVVVGFGCYVSVPAYLAARKRGVPIVVHEGNAIPGVANRLGARMTKHVATSFPGTDLPHAVCTGLPIRRMVSTMDRAALREQALTTFGLRDDLPTLLVTGVWPQSEGSIRVHDPQWNGLGAGWGLLSDRTVTVTAQTRRRPLASSVRVRLPGRDGALESVTTELAAAMAKADPGLEAATTAPATAGPTAWPTVGRTMPSNPLTAWRSASGTRAGSHAEYAG